MPWPARYADPTDRIAMRLPDALARDPDDEGNALGLLRRYFGDPFGRHPSAVGAAFDTWDSTGTRSEDVDRFTADDLVAVTFLSVDVPARAARLLLRDRADEFAELLTAVGPDHDLADHAEPMDSSSALWRLKAALRGMKLGVGRTTASKLIARKRPRLHPIWDTVIAVVTDTPDYQWEPLRTALQADRQALQRRLLALRDSAGLPDQVSALRVLDVIAWMEGKDQGF